MLLEVLKCLERLNDGSLDLSGLLSPPQNLAPLSLPQNEDENELRNFFLDVTKAIAKFNKNQKVIFDAVKRALYLVSHAPTCKGAEQVLNRKYFQAISTFNNGSSFYDAPGSTEKTFAMNTIHTFLESKGKAVVPVPTYAVVAQLFSKRKTAHATF